jgi:heat shock protein HslJ
LNGKGRDRLRRLRAGTGLVLLIVKIIRRSRAMHCRIVPWTFMVAASLIAAGNCYANPDTERQPTAGTMTQPDARDALAGTTWQLVEIASMDDRVYAPDDRTAYTLSFSPDGAMQIRADCNRGNGSWTSASAGRLEFGLIAATQALCPPGSLHDRYMAQFPWVRSYVMKGGHLFLATMADGSIIEFEPVQRPVAATVLGQEVRTTEAGEMQQVVLSRLFDRFAEEQGIEVADSEIDAYLAKMRRSLRAEGLTAEDDLSPEEAVQARQMQRDMARSMIRHWKLNRALHRHYGGRIIFQQLGPEPLDAYRQYLEERQSAGDFTIQEKAFEDEFWQYFVDDSRHDFYPAGSEQEQRAFAIPPWE